MSDLTKEIEDFVNNYKAQKGMEVPATEASFSGNGISFSFDGGKIVPKYNNPYLAKRSKLLSDNHAKKLAAQASKNNNFGRAL